MHLEEGLEKMEYKRFNNKLVLRIDRGEEIVAKLKEVALKEDIKLASVFAIGACDFFVAGVYDVSLKKYFENEFKGAYEITSLIGNINTMNKEYYSHLHINCADKDGNCFGGHLNKAVVSATCEMIIDIIDGKVDRFKDEVTGLNLFDFIKD